MTGSAFFLLPALLLITILSSLIPTTQAAALTTILAGHEKSCFYAWVDKAGEKVGFYFAVQSGGHFDIDYSVMNPADHVIIEGVKEKQLDIIFTGNTVGEYAFCFENEGAFSEKLIDFDITVESEPRLDLPLASGSPALSEVSAPLEESISKVGSQLSGISRTQRYFRTRENRNYATVVSTQARIFYYSLIESLAMMAISGAQVYVVRHLFNTGSTKRYRV